MADYFEPIEAPSSPESAQQFATRIDTQFNAAVARDNTLAEDAALDRFLVAGVGRIANHGAEVSVASGAVRISNGFFLAGPGVDSEDDAHFEGARLKAIASEAGYLELTGADEPPLNKSLGTWGYMSWYGDVVWFDSRQTDEEDVEALYRRWCLGKVTTNGVGATAIDTTYTDLIPNFAELAAALAALTARVEALEAGGGGGGGGGGEDGGFLYSGVAPWLPSPADDRQTSIVLLEKFAALEARIGTIEGSNTRPFQTRTDQALSRIALLEQGQARTHRDEARRYESAHVVLADDDVVYGLGESGDENFVGDGLQPDEEGKFVP